MFPIIDQLSSVVFPLRPSADTERARAKAARRGPVGSERESSHAAARQEKPKELRRPAEQELKAHLAALWRQTKLGMAIVSAEGRILDGNPELWAMLGSVPSDGPQLLASHFLPEQAELLDRLICSPANAADLAESPARLVCAFKGPDLADFDQAEEPRWLRLEVVSRLVHSVAISVEDITELIRLRRENQLKQKQLRHIQRLELVGEWSAGMAHEFNNLLQIVETYGAVIKREPARSEVIDRSIDEILVSVRRGSALLKHVLAFSRKSTVPFTLGNLEPVVTRCLDTCRYSLGARVKIECHTPAAPLHCRMDETLIEQALLNLCLNARDAMPEGGRLRIALQRVTLAAGTIGSTRLKAGIYAQISVTDSGVGIPAEMQSKIFEPFFTTKKLGAGTGLGLSIVHGIIREHGGAIDVRSTVGQGSTFAIYLPLVK